MIRYALGLVLALGACSAAVPPVERQSYRSETVRQSVILRGGAEAMQGAWIVRAGTPDGVRALRFGPASVTFEGARALRYDAREVATNQWRLGTGQNDLVVLWIDEGHRTAALGARDGSFAYIVDRKAAGGADRIRAAREILAFNGYDVSKLAPRG